MIGTLRGRGGPRILLIGHTDTVFDDGTVDDRPFRTEGGRAFGPGVSDMKGGLVAGFVAIRALRRTGFDDFDRITYVCNPDEEIGSPYSGPVIASLAGEHDAAFWTDVTVDGTRLRVFTFSYAPGAAVQIARPLDEVDRTLSRLVLLLAAISLGGIALAAVAGLVVAGPGLRPLRRLTAAAEHVSRTHDLSQRIDASGKDEVSRLAQSFNAMLAALEESHRARRQLVELPTGNPLENPISPLTENRLRSFHHGLFHGPSRTYRGVG